MEALSEFFPPFPTIEYDVLCAKIGWQSLKVIVPFAPFEQILEITRSIPDTPEISARNSVYLDIWYRLSPETHPH